MAKNKILNKLSTLLEYLPGTLGIIVTAILIISCFLSLGMFIGLIGGPIGMIIGASVGAALGIGVAVYGFVVLSTMKLPRPKVSKDLKKNETSLPETRPSRSNDYTVAPSEPKLSVELVNSSITVPTSAVSEVVLPQAAFAQASTQQPSHIEQQLQTQWSQLVLKATELENEIQSLERNCPSEHERALAWQEMRCRKIVNFDMKPLDLNNRRLKYFEIELQKIKDNIDKFKMEIKSYKKAEEAIVPCIIAALDQRLPPEDRRWLEEKNSKS